MADFDNEKNQSENVTGSEDIIDELESLSKKYGLAFDASHLKKTPSATVSSVYAPKKTDTAAITSAPPKNNHPARTPRIVYDSAIGSSSVKIVYGDEDEPQGPQGRRVVYQESASESIALKRRRNAAQRNTAQKSEKGSQGFGSQPYVKHVASSPAAIQRDDPQTFARAYADRVKHDEPVRPKAADADIPVSKGKDKLVASASDAKKTADNAKKEHKYYKKTPADSFKAFFKSFLPWKGDPAKEVIRKIVMDISAILVFACFGYFLQNYIQHKNEVEKNNNLESLITEPETSDLDARWAAIKAQYPGVNFPEGMNIIYADLYAQNQDLIGWLTVPGTSIHTSILYHPGDNDPNSEEDFYLHHSFYKSYSKYGNPYLDSFCTGTVLDQNNTIYGHNMRDGLQFAELEKYYTIDGFKESPIIKYDTLFESYTFKVYAAFISNGYTNGDNGYLFQYPNPNFRSEENFRTFIEAIDERKLYDTGVDINTSDKLIILSTCSYEIKQTNMGRLAVVGRLVRDGESENVDTSKATINENIRYPQIWYDENNRSNPYKNAYRWIPE